MFQKSLKILNKILIVYAILIVLFFSILNSSLFATNTIETITDANILEDEAFYANLASRLKDSDLYFFSNKSYLIEDIINGNAFISSNTLKISPKISENISGGIISGDLFVCAKDVNIESKVSDEGSLNKSLIYGNVFAMSNTFTLDSDCEVYGNLFIISKNVFINKNAIIRGNVFILSDNATLDCNIGQDLYAKCNFFEMKFDCFITRDLHLKSNSCILNGFVNKNSFIKSKLITLKEDFYNNNSFSSISNNIIFSGEIVKDANIESTKITFQDRIGNKNVICLINGDLNYTSSKELDINEGIVLR